MTNIDTDIDIYTHSDVIADDLHPLVAALDLDRLKWKLTQSSEAEMTVKDCDLAEREYRRYLNLKKLYPGKELVPSKLVDKFWHAHILDTVAYHNDCMSVFGQFLHHFPYFGIYGEEDYQNLQSAFADTISLYEAHYGPYPGKLNDAARCEDHACHVESSCACRSSGACK